MKKLLFLLSVLSVASCRNSNGPIAPMPIQSGAQGTFYYTHTIPNRYGQDSIQYNEKLTFASRPDTSFVGLYTPFDGPNADSIVYRWLTSGDLQIGQVENCFKTPLPVTTHSSYLPSSNTVYTPTKQNGFVANGSVAMSSEYLGQEQVVVGMVSYDCEKLRRDVIVRAASGLANGALNKSQITNYYWYSPALGFFAKEVSRQEDSTATGILSHGLFQRVLTSNVK